MKCEICSEEYSVRGFGGHIRAKHKLTSKDYYDMYIKTENESICHCGKSTKFITINSGYSQYCSTRCINLDPKVRAKIEATSIERYGVKCNLNLDEVKNKAKANSQNESAILKRQQTNIDRYGAANVFASEEIKQKIQATNLTRYGVRYSWQSELVKNKIKLTNIDRYGHQYPQRSDTIKSSMKLVRRKRIEQFKNMNNCTERQDLIKLYGTGWIYTDLGLNMLNAYGVSFIKNDEIRLIKQYFDMNHTKTSQFEQNFYNCLTTIYDGSIICNSRSIISPYELDIYIPKLKLAIECNGSYWHSDMCKDINYHLDKSILCREKGIRLIHIYEFENIDEQLYLLTNLINGIDLYNENDFNKNNLILNIPDACIVYSNDQYNVYGAGQLYTNTVQIAVNE